MGEWIDGWIYTHRYSLPSRQAEWERESEKVSTEKRRSAVSHVARALDLKLQS